jgi:hypothetical protein
MNGTNRNKPIVTRPPPPIPKEPSTITDDLLLIDFSESPLPQKTSEKKIEENNSLEQLVTNHHHHHYQRQQSPIIQTSYPSPVIQQRFSSNINDPQKFVAKVVTGVTEQLKNDFPRLNSSKKEFTPPLVRRFTVPYPSSYYNLHHRPQ